MWQIADAHVCMFFWPIIYIYTYSTYTYMSDGSDGSYLVKSSLGVYPGCRTYNILVVLVAKQGRNIPRMR